MQDFFFPLMHNTAFLRNTSSFLMILCISLISTTSVTIRSLLLRFTKRQHWHSSDTHKCLLLVHFCCVWLVSTYDYLHNNTILRPSFHNGPFMPLTAAAALGLISKKKSRTRCLVAVSPGFKRAASRVWDYHERQSNTQANKHPAGELLGPPSNFIMR